MSAGPVVGKSKLRRTSPRYTLATEDEFWSRIPSENPLIDGSHSSRFYQRGQGGVGRPYVWVLRGDRARVKVGSAVTFGRGVEIWTGGNHHHDWVTMFALREVYDLPDAFVDLPWSHGDVRIGDMVTVGDGAKIMSGLQIGDGAVIRPYSIVTRDVASLAVVGGHPAREETRLPEPPRRPFPPNNLMTSTSALRRLRRRIALALSSGARLLDDYGDITAAPSADRALEAAPVQMGTASYSRPLGWRPPGSTSRVIVGRYASIFWDVECLLEPAGHRQELQAGGQSRDLTIGHDTWVGRGAKLVGASVGDGAVVAAYSVVTEDVSPYRIVGGNPAREIGHRFGDDVVAGLLRIRWWDWPEDVILARWGDICSPDIAGFVERYHQSST